MGQIQSGYKLFFAPDPKSAMLNFKYGREDKEPVVSFGPLRDNAVEFPLSLKERVDESRIVNHCTGNAVTVEKGMYSYVFGRAMIFSGNDSCKRRFKERVKDEIIENNRYVYFNRIINDRDLRERICLDAMSAAEMKTTPSRLDAESDKEKNLMML